MCSCHTAVIECVQHTGDPLRFCTNGVLRTPSHQVSLILIKSESWAQYWYWYWYWYCYCWVFAKWGEKNDQTRSAANADRISANYCSLNNSPPRPPPIFCSRPYPHYKGCVFLFSSLWNLLSSLFARASKVHDTRHKHKQQGS